MTGRYWAAFAKYALRRAKAGLKKFQRDFEKSQKQHGTDKKGK